MTEEKDPAGSSDTSRFLAAGARRSFWVRTEQGKLGEALSALRRRLAESENAIIESNSIVEFIHPDLYITLLDPEVEDFKTSARQLFERTDAVILPEGTIWQSPKPTFHIRPPEYLTREVVMFVSERLALARIE